MKHIKIVNDVNNEVVTDEWRIIKPRSIAGKNFFYSYDTGSDAMRAAQEGEVPKKGVQDFISFCKMVQEQRLVEHFERQKACRARQQDESNGGYESISSDSSDDDNELDLLCSNLRRHPLPRGVYRCFVCDRISMQTKCCRYCPGQNFCFELSCIMAREWLRIHQIVSREWANFYGDRDPLLFNGLLLMELPSVAQPELYKEYRIEECYELNDDNYAF